MINSPVSMRHQSIDSRNNTVIVKFHETLQYADQNSLNRRMFFLQWQNILTFISCSVMEFPPKSISSLNINLVKQKQLDLLKIATLASK